MSNSFRVVIFSGAEPGRILRLVTRIHKEVPEARVSGVLVERRPGKTVNQRTLHFLRNLGDPAFVRYAASKTAQNARRKAGRLGEAVLDFIHGGSPEQTTSEDPVQRLESMGCSFHVTSDYHGQDALDFARELQPDLGIVYGTRILKPCLFSIPRLGSINIHKRKVPDYRGGGPVGLWELLDDQPNIGVTVHQVTEKLDAGAIVNAATIPIERFDNLTSLSLKAHVVGNDLLVRSVADFARNTLQLTPQTGSGRMFKSPSPQQLATYEMKLAKHRPGFKPLGSRPLAKLAAKTIVAIPQVTLRNRKRRQAQSFPVSILFHHLISDRPHRMGLPTEYFLRHVEFLRRHYHIVSLTEAIELLRTNNVTRPTVVLTFDDGYADNFINLRAIVEHTGIPITLFVSTDHITRQKPFRHDTDAGCEEFQPLSWDQLRIMHAEGFEIGSHTRTHYDCGARDLGELEEEIAGSKRDLERHLKQTVETFSFPFGLPENISNEAAALAARTYSYLLSAYGGENIAKPGSELKHLKRWCHPNRLWDLELQLQGVLESEPEFAMPPAILQTIPVSGTPIQANS